MSGEEGDTHLLDGLRFRPVLTASVNMCATRLCLPECVEFVRSCTARTALKMRVTLDVCVRFMCGKVGAFRMCNSVVSCEMSVAFCTRVQRK